MACSTSRSSPLAVIVARMDSRSWATDDEASSNMPVNSLRNSAASTSAWLAHLRSTSRPAKKENHAQANTMEYANPLA